jgi:hypothetical protein
MTNGQKLGLFAAGGVALVVVLYLAANSSASAAAPAGSTGAVLPGAAPQVAPTQYAPSTFNVPPLAGGGSSLPNPGSSVVFDVPAIVAQTPNVPKIGVTGTTSGDGGVLSSCGCNSPQTGTTNAYGSQTAAASALAPLVQSLVGSLNQGQVDMALTPGVPAVRSAELDILLNALPPENGAQNQFFAGGI